MKTERFLPALPLRPFIKTYLVIETPNERVNRVLPNTSITMALRFKGKVNFQEEESRELPFTVLSGLRKSRKLINYAANTGNILVIFKAGCAGMFIKEPLHELFEESVSLSSLADFQNITNLEEQLAEATSNAARITLVEDLLLARLDGQKPDRLIHAAMHQIQTTKGTLRIKSLADELCISMDAFEKRFRRLVGVTPKQFSYLTRMQSVVQGGIRKKNFTEVALAAGYFDQAHFNKDFKHYTGQTPTEFLKSPVAW